MFIDPKRIVFENENDVINYVSGGLPPMRKNFEKVMYAVKNPDDEESAAAKAGNDVVIKAGTISEDRVDALESIIRKTYENRIRNRNAILILAGAIVGGMIFGSVRSKRNDAEDKDDEKEK